MFSRISLFIASSILCLLGAELAVRWHGQQNGVDYRLHLVELKNPRRLPPRLYDKRPGDPLPVRLKANEKTVGITSDFEVTYKTNSMGFGDEEFAAAPQKKHVALALGDSFTFGEGVSYGKRFTEVIEKLNPSLQVHNLAVPGYGLDEILVNFLLNSPEVSADYVFLFVNRVDTTRAHLPIVIDDKLVIPSVRSTQPLDIETASAYLSTDDDLFKDIGWASRKSQFLSLLNYRIQLSRLKSTIADRDSEVWGGPTSVTAKDSDVPRLEHNQKIRRRTEIIIKKLIDTCQERDLTLLVFNIDPNWKLDYVRKLVGSKNFFDYSPQLTKRAVNSPLRFTYDKHFNSDTHEFIGELVAKDLEKIKVRLKQ